MYSDRFQHFFDLLLDLEGKRNFDRGGDTVCGIARRFHRDEPWPPTPERIKEIYRDEYYTPLRVDEIKDDHVAFQMFVAGVNIGVADVKKHIWTLLLLPLTSTIIGPVTIQHLNDAIDAGWDAVYSGFLYGMIDHYFYLAEPEHDPTGENRRSLKGWMHRLALAINLKKKAGENSEH